MPVAAVSIHSPVTILLFIGLFVYEAASEKFLIFI